VNPAAHQLNDLPLATAAIREQDAPTPLVPRLVAEIRHIALASRDAGVRTALLTLIRE
jgi:hypothetical protein